MQQKSTFVFAYVQNICGPQCGKMSLQIIFWLLEINRYDLKDQCFKSQIAFIWLDYSKYYVRYGIFSACIYLTSFPWKMESCRLHFHILKKLRKLFIGLQQLNHLRKSFCFIGSIWTLHTICRKYFDCSRDIPVVMVTTVWYI